MSLFTRVRHWLFRIDLPDTEALNAQADAVDERALEQRQRALQLMRQWNPERAEDLRRINRTGNPWEGFLAPERRGEQR